MPQRPLHLRIGWTLRDYAKRVWDNSGEDNIFFLAGGIAFNILLAAVPFVLLGCTFACSRDAGAPARDSTATTSGALVAGTALAAPHIGPAGEWQTPAGDYAASRYSELAQITSANAKNLHAAWTPASFAATRASRSSSGARCMW